MAEEERDIEAIMGDVMRLERSLKPIELQLVLQSRYERVFGIRDHGKDDPENHYPLVAFNYHDDYQAQSPLYELMTRFITERIGHHTNLSLVEFLNLPRHYVEHIFKSCAKVNKTEDEGVQHLQRSFELQQREAQSQRNVPRRTSHKPSRS